MIYETKGLSLEEVDEMYETINNAWQSDSFVPSRGFRKEETKNTGAVGSGEKLKGDIPVVDQSSEHTEGEHAEGNGVATEVSE
jgi:SP family sugar:H+ symporter-like MFS transporter